MSGSSNPALARLARVQAQWLAFAATTEARLLVWQAATQEQTVLEAFVARETDEGEVETGAVFVRFTARQAAYRAHHHPLREHIERLLGPDLPSAAAVETAAP